MKLMQQGMLAEGDVAATESAVASQVSDAVAFAEAGPWEPAEDLTKDVYTTVTP
jgi:TPP-dependent pyruvate/acetoin dehydrogenase alpha subunit